MGLGQTTARRKPLILLRAASCLRLSVISAGKRSKHNKRVIRALEQQVVAAVAHRLPEPLYSCISSMGDTWNSKCLLKLTTIIQMPKDEQREVVRQIRKPKPIGRLMNIASADLGVAAIIQNYFFHPDYKKIATTQIVNKAEQSGSAELKRLEDYGAPSQNAADPRILRSSLTP
jgi:hypothetical protein